MASTEASCWVNNKLRAHEEQWKEDDCTFCQCVDGEPHCTAMACKQSCHNPVKIPGECCPFCEGTELCCPSNELRISTHTKCRALLRPCSFSTEPTQHGLIKGGGHSCPGSISVCLWLLGGVIVASHPHYQEHL